MVCNDIQAYCFSQFINKIQDDGSCSQGADKHGTKNAKIAWVVTTSNKFVTKSHKFFFSQKAVLARIRPTELSEQEDVVLFHSADFSCYEPLLKSFHNSFFRNMFAKRINRNENKKNYYPLCSPCYDGRQYWCLRIAQRRKNGNN